MPSVWYRSPHRDVAQRRAGETSPSFELPVPTTTSSTPISHFDSPFNGSSTSFQSSSSFSTESHEDSTDAPTGSAPPSTASSLISSASSSISSETSSATSGLPQSSSSTPSTESVSSSSSHVSSPSKSRSSGSVGTPLTQKVLKTSSNGTPSTPTTLVVVTTPTDVAGGVEVTINQSIAQPSATGVTGSLQSGMNQNNTSSSESTHKNVIIGVSVTFGGIIVLGAILLVLLRLISKNKKAKAEKSRREQWRRSADSWIGTRMGESRAATPAFGGILGTWRSARRHSLGLSAPPQASDEMQQTQSAMVSEYLGRHAETALRVPEPSHSRDSESISLDLVGTPPGSTTGLMFSGAESELAYADHTAPTPPDIPIIRVTDPGADYSRPPTTFSDLVYNSPPHHTARDTQNNHISATLDALTGTRSQPSVTSSSVENPFIHPSEKSYSSSHAPTSLLGVTTLQVNNVFHSQRDSATSVKSPSKYFRVSDPFGAAVHKMAPAGVVPVISVPEDGNSIMSLEGHVVHPTSTSRKL
ncbi:hypothetical protein BDY19DRAFT_437797 [Irpex rosettiformis]|uniref:Uncharacterized protein n=1 Tax=Irpex rosettiformis TaxID=378272 RepID=A0ACB8TU21_9APHY|nr:hypothetical protein BDY19DRAFT_437797 [Irpex rosettiformis]